MSSTQLTTFADLYTDLLQRLRVSTTVSATLEQGKRYINIALHDMHLGFDYKLPWCERQGYLRTKTPYTTGTVSISIGSSTLTGSSTAWNTNNSHSVKNVVVGGKFLFSGVNEIYKVASVSSDTSVGLATNFIGDATPAALSASAYTYFEDEYALASTFLRPIDFQSFSPEMNISLISRAEFRRRYPVVKISGRPQVACLIDTNVSGSDASGTRKVVLFPYPDKEYIIPYSYVTSSLAFSSAGAAQTSLSADADVPIVPLRYRHAIVYHALAHWYRDKKDDARADAAKAEYDDIMLRIINDLDIATHTKAQMQPVGGRYHRYAYRPYGRTGMGGRVYDLNDDFDSFRR